MPARIPRTRKYPHAIRLKPVVFPWSVHRYEIVQQGAVLNRWEDAPNTVRSTKPFSIKLQDGTIRHSRVSVNPSERTSR